MSSKKTITTTYRKLENFLYAIGIQALRSFKEWDGSTVWEYEDTPELRIATEAFKKLEADMRALKGGQANER